MYFFWLWGSWLVYSLAFVFWWIACSRPLPVFPLMDILSLIDLTLLTDSKYMEVSIVNVKGTSLLLRVECWSRGAEFPSLTLEEEQSPRARQENSTWIGLPTQFPLLSSSEVRMERNWQNSSHCWPVPADKGKRASTLQLSSVAQSCLTLCDPMNRSILGLPVHHQLPEFTQTHVHRVSDAIQPSHPLSSPSPPALNPSQHQSLFQWVNSSHEVAKVLVFQL